MPMTANHGILRFPPGPGAIFDAEAIAVRRRHLFGGSSNPGFWHDREAMGTATQHCDICPKDKDELCHLSCMGTREELRKKDGVAVT